MGVIAARDAKLNQAITSGKVLEVFEDVYHPDVEMYENLELAGRGIEANRQRTRRFFESIAAFRGGGVIRSAVNEPAGVSFAEMFFDCTFADGREMTMTEVAVRQWMDGKIVREQFFYKG